MENCLQCAVRGGWQVTKRENKKCKWNIIDPVQVVAGQGGGRQNIKILFWKYLVDIGNEAWGRLATD
jgi:hypothetical protein